MKNTSNPPPNTPFAGLKLKVGKINYNLGNLDPNWPKCLKSGQYFSRSGQKHFFHWDGGQGVGGGLAGRVASLVGQVGQGGGLVCGAGVLAGGLESASWTECSYSQKLVEKSPSHESNDQKKHLLLYQHSLNVRWDLNILKMQY